MNLRTLIALALIAPAVLLTAWLGQREFQRIVEEELGV